jgi:hypothetical protein
VPRPVPEVVGILEGALYQARKGNIRSIFVLAQDRAGDYIAAYETDDLDDMLYELGSEIILARIASKRIEAAAREQ